MSKRRAKPNLGERLKAIRKAKKLSLTEAAELSGISRSTLYKVENNGVSLTYGKLVELSEGLSVDISDFFSADVPGGDKPALVATRLVTGKLEKGKWIETPNYQYLYLASELRQKKMIPTLLKMRKKTIAEFGQLLAHPGQEFSIVLQGEVTVHTEYFEPVTIRGGEFLYMDSVMPHAYIASGDEDSIVLTVTSSHELD